MLATFRNRFERALEAIAFFLICALTVIVVVAVIYRYTGRSLVWYDELASVGLVWLTYYGAALAALKGSHLGVPALVNAFPPAGRVAATLFAEACVFLFFGVLAVTGYQVMLVLVSDGMVSLPWVSLAFTQSAIPVGAVLFMIAEALRLPEVLRAAYAGPLMDSELKEALEQAEHVEAELEMERRS